MTQPDLQGEIGPSTLPVPAIGGPIHGLFEAVPDAMVATDPDGVVVAVNAEGGRLLGRDVESLAGTPFVELIAEQSRESYAAHRRILLAGRWDTAPELEVDLLHASGRAIPIDATVGRYQTGDGPVVLMVLRDVTDRVNTQEVLERRVALDELVVRISGRLNTPTLVEIDDEIHNSLRELGEFAGADRSYILEVSDDGGTITTIHEWRAPGLESGIGLIVDQPFDRLPWVAGQLAAKRVVQIESPDRLPPEAGAERDYMAAKGIRWSVIVPMVSGSKVVGMLGLDAVENQAVRWPADAVSTFVVLQDFFMNAVQRKRVGAELRRANRILQAVTRCNDALVRAVDEEELLREVCRVVVEAGDFAMAWVGYAVDDLLRSITPMAHWGVGADYVENLELTWQDAAWGTGPAGIAVRTRKPVAIQNVAADPEFEPWRENAVAHGFASTVSVPLVYGTEVVGVMAVYAYELGAFDAPEVAILQRFADDLAFGISALRARQRQREVEAQLRETLRSKDAFVATIAHELRTPLTAVVGFAQLLQGGGADLTTEDRREMVRMIVDEGVDLTNIVDDLLVAAKAEAGTLTAAHVRVDLLAQASQVVETWGDLAGDRIRLSGPSVAAISDPARVRQVLRNLVSNALRYGGDHIEVLVARTDSTASVTVSDDGVGVPPEDEETIFEPYRRAHDAPGVTASMGLGLTISRQLARLMGGDLLYRRAEGITTFELTLPAVE